MKLEERLAADEAIDPLLFYSPRDPHGCFSNFSWHEILLPNPWTNELEVYLTGEHRYQAMKADNEEDHDYVLEVDNPGAAQRRGRQVGLREGWREDHLGLGYYVMLELILAKTLQHLDVQDELRTTGDRHIYEDSPTDDIWGWRHGPSYNGNNLLGRCWMQVRDMLL